MSERPLRVLISWLDWWRIDHWAVKAINYKLSPLIGLAGAIGAYFLPPHLNLWRENGAVWLTNGLLQPLVGFFIAALAAVATFQRQGLDDPMGADPPQLSRKEGRSIENLSRRRFLCLLFGYLSGNSISLYIGGMAIILVEPQYISFMTAHYVLFHQYLRPIGFGVYSFVFGHMIITSFLGLYFLVDRIHASPLKSGFPNLSGSEARSDSPGTEMRSDAPPHSGWRSENE
jgi:hypothetical protein